MTRYFKKSMACFIFAAILLLLPAAVSAESVGGISIGMPQTQVIALYGNPD